VTDSGTDGQTDGQTDRRTGVSKERAIAYMLSRAKNMCTLVNWLTEVPMWIGQNVYEESTCDWDV